jgi:hypothetical protein
MARRGVLSIANGPKYPFVKVQVSGTGGAFFPTVTAVQMAMSQAGTPEKELSNFYEDAAEDDEDNLLQTCLRWVDVDVS